MKWERKVEGFTNKFVCLGCCRLGEVEIAGDTASKMDARTKIVGGLVGFTGARDCQSYRYVVGFKRKAGGRRIHCKVGADSLAVR